MAEHSQILMLGELSKGNLSASTLELLGGGREIADRLNGALTLALLGENLAVLGTEAIAY